MNNANIIDRLTAEGLLTMAQVARLYPNGSHKSTPIRHATRGVMVRGVRIKLEAIMVGGRLCTSRPALMRFFASQNQGTAAQPAPRSFAQRRREVAKARTELRAMLGMK